MIPVLGMRNGELAECWLWWSLHVFNGLEIKLFFTLSCRNGLPHHDSFIDIGGAFQAQIQNDRSIILRYLNCNLAYFLPLIILFYLFGVTSGMPSLTQ